jgi:molybdate transport system substrate-binding protein
VTFAPDSELAQRTAAGPAPDVLAVEGPAPLAAAGSLGPPVHFAGNQLVLAVPDANPKGVVRLTDINRSDVRVALCTDTEPCGTVTAAVLTAAGVAPPATALRVPDVRSALTALSDGTVDAALVYRSDARLAGDAVTTVEFPESRAALADHQAAVPAAATNPRAAAAFLAYLTSPRSSTPSSTPATNPRCSPPSDVHSGISRDHGPGLLVDHQSWPYDHDPRGNMITVCGQRRRRTSRARRRTR